MNWCALSKRCVLIFFFFNFLTFGSNRHKTDQYLGRYLHMHTHKSEVRVSKLILMRVSLDNNINNINNTNKSCFCKIPGIFAKRFFSMGRYFAEKMIQKGQKQKIGSFFYWEILVYTRIRKIEVVMFNQRLHFQLDAFIKAIFGIWKSEIWKSKKMDFAPFYTKRFNLK